MQQKFFIKRFAELGDRETVPNDTQITGDVSYEQGYTYDYQRDQATDPLAKPIERTKLNAVFHDITGELQQYQTTGTPIWATKADNDGQQFPYTQCARVLYRAEETDHWAVYESLVDNNTATPSDADKWRRIVSAIASEEQARAGTDNNTIMTPLRVKQAIAASSSHVGQIIFEPSTSAPTGYLKCNGALVNRADYPRLWEYAQQRSELLTDALWHQEKSYGCFSLGDGSTTFRIPDLRAQFIRCWDDGRGIDEGRLLGSYQAGAIQSHNHSASMEEAGEHNHGGETSINGEHDHDTKIEDQNIYGCGFRQLWSGDNHSRFGDKTGVNGNHHHDISTDGMHQHAIKIDAEGGSETRPSNIALLAVIRY